MYWLHRSVNSKKRTEHDWKKTHIARTAQAVSSWYYLLIFLIKKKKTQNFEMDMTVNKIQMDDLLSKTEVFPISLWMDILMRLEHLSEPQSPLQKPISFSVYWWFPMDQQLWGQQVKYLRCLHQMQLAKSSWNFSWIICIKQGELTQSSTCLVIFGLGS